MAWFQWHMDDWPKCENERWGGLLWSCIIYPSCCCVCFNCNLSDWFVWLGASITSKYQYLSNKFWPLAKMTFIKIDNTSQPPSNAGAFPSCIGDIIQNLHLCGNGQTVVLVLNSHPHTCMTHCKQGSAHNCWALAYFYSMKWQMKTRLNQKKSTLKMHQCDAPDQTSETQYFQCPQLEDDKLT